MNKKGKGLKVGNIFYGMGMEWKHAIKEMNMALTYLKDLNFPHLVLFYPCERLPSRCFSDEGLKKSHTRTW